MKRIVPNFLRVVFLLSVLSSTACLAETVKLAYIAYMSGPFALLGDEALKAFQAAADIVNSKGGVLGGKKIEIVPFDGISVSRRTPTCM